VITNIKGHWSSRSSETVGLQLLGGKSEVVKHTASKGPRMITIFRRCEEEK